MAHDKMALVNKEVKQKFDDARLEGQAVHDIDLQQWAFEKATALGLTYFQASPTWLLRFKRRNGIKSRKVTMVCTKRQAENAGVIQQAAADFRIQVLQEVKNYPPNLIFNSDQSGFTYEMYSRRTLSKQGEKDTIVQVDSVNKTKHSYTVQPLLDYNGQLRGKLYLCLQETTGRMGPRVKKTLFAAPNVELTCSKSGNLTTSLLQRWAEKVLLNEIVENKR